MNHYSVAEIEITNKDWIAGYVEHVTQMVERSGGRYLARTFRSERMEGDGPSPHPLLLIEWPSQEHAATFYASEAYRPFLQSRLAGSRGHLYLVPGEDIGKSARAGS